MSDGSDSPENNSKGGMFRRHLLKGAALLGGLAYAGQIAKLANQDTQARADAQAEAENRVPLTIEQISDLTDKQVEELTNKQIKTKGWVTYLGREAVGTITSQPIPWGVVPGIPVYKTVDVYYIYSDKPKDTKPMMLTLFSNQSSNHIEVEKFEGQEIVIEGFVKNSEGFSKPTFLAKHVLDNKGIDPATISKYVDAVKIVPIIEDQAPR